MDKQMDEYGFDHYRELPENFREATLDDFHHQGRKKIGMTYLIKWEGKEYYEIRTVTDELSASWLKPFIDAHRVFIKN